jgi:predicted metal-dependent phosphoesterase TrpH
MDLVTITDHDSIEGGLELLNRLGDLPDFILGEEVSTYFPEFRHEVHIGVYGLSEAQHREIQKLRSNGEELVAYLRRSGLLFVLNHLFLHFWDLGRVQAFVERMAELFDIFEIRNGTQQREHNSLIVRLLERYRQEAHGRPVGVVAGSDSHTLRRIGRTFTASAARTREEFLDDIRHGRAQVFGLHSNHLSLAADIYGVVLRHYPTVLSVRNGEFSPLVRLKNFFLSLVAAPFLLTPYLVAIRHSHIERRRINDFWRIFYGDGSSFASS